MKNILIVTSEYSCDNKPNERWPKIVSYFAQQWSKYNNVIVIINSSKFPKIYYKFGFVLRKIVAKLYHRDPSFITDSSWNHAFDFYDGDIKVYNRPMLKFYPHGKFGHRQLNKQVKIIDKILQNNHFIPDVIVGHWFYPQCEIILRLKEHYEAKCSLVLHGSVTGGTTLKMQDGRKLDMLDRVGCRNKPMTEYLYEELKLRELPFVCPSGLPDEYAINAIKNKNLFSNSMLKIVSTCRLLDWKCIDSAIRGVAAAYKSHDYLYEILGEGPQRGRITEVINELDVADKVSLLGRRPRKEVQSRLEEADIFILISKHETFGLVYLEAMIQGCITIGSRNGGIDGIIKDGINGFLCEEGSCEDLTRILLHINSLTAGEKIRISQNAKETALYYTDSKVAQRYLENIT